MCSPGTAVGGKEDSRKGGVLRGIGGEARPPRPAGVLFFPEAGNGRRGGGGEREARPQDSRTMLLSPASRKPLVHFLHS